jgi:branched-chain amino acid transport system substrate-binding protein
VKSHHLPYSFTLTLALTLLAGCGGESTPAETHTTTGVTATEVRLGSSAALGGHAKFLGTQYTRGAQAHFNEINATGGVHGRQIRLVSYDDQYDPPKTVENTARLIGDDQVFMLFGYVGTPTSVKIIDLVHEAKIPALGFFTGAEALRTPFRPYMFHVRASYYAEAEGAVAYFVDTLGHRKIAVLYQDDAFGLAVLKGVQLALGRREVEIAAADSFQRGSMEVEAAAESIQASQADAVIMVGTYAPLAKFIRVCHDRGFAPYFHTVSFIGSGAFAKELRVVQKVDAAQHEKIMVTQVVPSPAAPDLSAVQAYRTAAAKHFPDDPPNYVALEGYVNARILVHALRAAGADLSRERLIEALEALRDFDAGIGKTITFGPSDRLGLQGIYYSRLAPSGQFEVFQR